MTRAFRVSQFPNLQNPHLAPMRSLFTFEQGVAAVHKRFASVLSDLGLLVAGEYLWCHIAHRQYWRRTAARDGRMQCWDCGRMWRGNRM